MIMSRIRGMASQRSERVDVVFDTYPECSIKSLEHCRRSAQNSARQHIYSAEQRLPVRWKAYLTNDGNKEELVEFLYSQWTKSPPQFPLFIAHGPACHRIVSCVVTEVVELRSDHVKADTRLILHAWHASRCHPHVTIWTPDSDVPLNAVSHMGECESSVYIETSSGEKARILDLAELYETMGGLLSRSLIGAQVFTGCDSTSSFHGKGKR